MAQYKRLRVLFPDHLGLARGKYIPAGRSSGTTRHCISMFGLGFDRTVSAAPGAKLLEGSPDCELHYCAEKARPCWEPDTGVVVGDLHFEGEPLALSPRQVLRRAVSAWEQQGYQSKLGIELEAYVLESDGNNGWRAWSTPGAYAYGTGRFVDPVGLFDEIMATAERSGLPVEAVNSEYDAPQFEFTLGHSDALDAADNAFLFRLMAREIAAKHGLLLTFLGKPMANRSGSGLHTNFSLKNSAGNNAFADPKNEDGISELARQCIAGIIDHHAGMTALCAPTVNAYKRLQPGQLAGYWANWGYDHRGVTLRVPQERGQSTRLEHRMADGSASVYLVSAAVMQAARLGVVHKLTPPPAEEQDCLTHQSTTKHVPDDLRLALDALEVDQDFREAVGQEFISLFLAVKRVEWQKFATAVTNWELDYYLPFL